MTSWTHLLFEGWGLVMVFMKWKMLSNWLQVGVWASPPPQRGRRRWEGPGTHHQPSHRDHPPVCPSRSWYVPNSSFFGGVWRGLVVIATKIFLSLFNSQWCVLRAERPAHLQRLCAHPKGEGVKKSPNTKVCFFHFEWWKGGEFVLLVMDGESFLHHEAWVNVESLLFFYCYSGSHRSSCVLSPSQICQRMKGQAKK